MEKLKKFIGENYKPENGAITEMWSEGNSTDVFNDGEKLGECWALYQVAKLIGLDVKKPEEQELI